MRVAPPKRAKRMTAAEKKRQSQDAEKIKAEFAWRTHVPLQYIDLGHSASARELDATARKVWGIERDHDAQMLPFLWWWNGKEVVLWEIKHRKDIHDDIPQYRKDGKTACSGVNICTEMPLYQGRVDKIRKIVTLISAKGTRNSIMFDRALERGKRRVDTALRSMFPGYTIHDMDDTPNSIFDLRLGSK